MYIELVTDGENQFRGFSANFSTYGGYCGWLTRVISQSRYHRDSEATIRDNIAILGRCQTATLAPYGQSGSPCYRYISTWRGVVYAQLGSYR